MYLYDIASKHGIPENRKYLDLEADIKTENEYVRHKERVDGANAMKAQYDELLKGLVVDEEVLAKMLSDLYAPQRLNAYFDHEGVAKALANSTEIIRKK